MSLRTLLISCAVLLGLTATPERSDDMPVLGWFDNRIAAELRLWDAIDQHRLTPFVYYGISDGLDLREVPWRRGRGYDVQGLTNVLTANDVWAKHVLSQLAERVDNLKTMRALGFCVSVAHAEFMARRPAVALVEVHSENFFGAGGYDLHVLESVRARYPLSFHGVGLALTGEPLSAEKAAEWGLIWKCVDDDKLGAAEMGKQVVVLVEITARFDEPVQPADMFGVRASSDCAPADGVNATSASHAANDSVPGW